MEAVLYPQFEYTFIEGIDQNVKTYLDKVLNIEELDIEDIFTNTQLTKLEHKERYVFIVLQFPEYNSERSLFEEKEIHCIVNKKQLVIIDKHNFHHAKQFHRFRDSLISPTSSFDMFFELLDFLITRAYKAIGKFMAEVSSMEHRIFDYESHQDLIFEIASTKRNIITYANIMKPMESMIVELGGNNNSRFTSKGIEKLDDSLDKIKKIENNVQSLKERINVVLETNEALIARSTNEIIKRLTSWSIIMLLPALISGALGMNVYTGWLSSSWFGTIITYSALVVVTLAAYTYFKKKRWL